MPGCGGSASGGEQSAGRTSALVGSRLVGSSSSAGRLIYRLIGGLSKASAASGRGGIAAVGLALAAFTLIYAIITPRLVGSLQVYGAFVAVFAAMIWLSYVAQAILVGAAWVYRRTGAPAVQATG